jgi:membrane protein DedA with SNARE-associated domain
VLYNASGALAWSTSVALAGYFLAYSWDTLERWIGNLGLLGLVVGIGLIFIVFLRNRRTRPS